MKLDEVDTFVVLVYPSEASRIALCLIPPHGEGPEHRFTAVDHLGRFLSYAAYRNAHGWGIFITPSVLKPMASRRRKEFFQNTQRVIYLDCDQASCLEHIQARYPYPTLVVRTSPGRHQVYWRLDQPVSIAQQEQLMSAMALDVQADRAATDVSRVLRLPGFWNRKPQRNNTVDIVFTRDHAVSYTSLSEKLPTSLCCRGAPTTTASNRTASPRVLGGVGEPGGKSRPPLSRSEIDWYEVHRRLALGDDPNHVIIWLEQRRTNKRDPKYYAERTVRKALAERRHNSHPNC